MLWYNVRVYCVIYFYDYLSLLNFYAMGNIKTFAKKITLDNAMLRYLDNTDNNAENPNENYAREFLELFTILKGAQISEGDYTNYSGDGEMRKLYNEAKSILMK